MTTCLRSFAIGVLAIAAIQADETSSRRAGVRGEILSMRSYGGSLTVELVTQDPGIPERAMVNPDGTFEFRSAPVGTYRLRVIGPQGTAIHEEMVTVGGSQQFLTIHLAEPPNASRAMGGGSISLRQLTHKIPSAAKKA